MKLKVFLLFILIVSCFIAKAQTGSADSAYYSRADTAVVPIDTSSKKKIKTPYIHQFRIGVDISRIAFNIMYPSKQGYEVQADYLLPRQLYLAAEAGFGRGKVDYDNLKYDNKSIFVRIGIEKQFLDVISTKDFDIGFIGARYGIGIGSRGDATYTISSPFGTPTEGSIPAQNFVVHWGEITGGIKVELWQGIFAGWNIRGKFMMNSGVFKQLAPGYIPGYGRGDKTTVFDFNFYLSYAIRWKK